MTKPIIVNRDSLVEHLGFIIRTLETQSHKIRKYGAISADAEAGVIDGLVTSLRSIFNLLKKAPENDLDSAIKCMIAVDNVFLQALDNKILNPEPRTIISRLFESFKSFYNKYIAGVESSKAIINNISNLTTISKAGINQANHQLNTDNPPTTRRQVQLATDQQLAVLAFAETQSKYKKILRDIRTEDPVVMTENPVRRSKPADPVDTTDKGPSI